MAMASYRRFPAFLTRRSPAGFFFLSLLLLLCVRISATAQEIPRTSQDAASPARIEEAVTLHEQIVQRGAEEWRQGKSIGKNSPKRTEWFYFQRRYPFDQIPAGARADAMRHVESMQRHMDLARAMQKSVAAQAAVAAWEPVGPANVGGRIRAVAVHPVDGGTVYIGAAAGGVWKTTNSGESWTTGFDKLSSLTIGSLAIDPNNPEIIYAGTGELRPAVDVTLLSDGMFKSTDGGATWTNIGLRSVGAINKIWVDSRNSQIIYAASGRSDRLPNERGNGAGMNIGSGFYRSTDGGQNWTKTRDGVFYDMAVNPANEDEIYLSTTNNVHRSTDGGLNFTTAGSSAGLSISAGIRVSVAVAPNDPSIVYALAARAQGGSSNMLADVYVSTNKGVSWTLRRAIGDNVFAAQGDYNNCIAVSPVNPDVVLIGGIDVHRSEDGGATWTNVTNVYAVRDDRLGHADQHILVFDPQNPQVVYLGNDGGMYFSVTEGLTWEIMTTTLPITQFYTVAVDQTREFRLYGGTQDNNTQGMFGANAITPSWLELLGGDGFHVVVDKNDPNVIYAESQYGNMSRINVTTGAGQVRSIDRGISTAGYWSTPMIQSPVDGKLYSGRYKLWVTANPRAAATGDIRWDSLTPGNANLMCALDASPFDAGKLIIGSLRGEIFATTNGGANWTRSTGTPSRFVTDLIYDPVNPNRIYATFSGYSSGHVYRSDDNGATFVDISNNLPNMPINAIEIDPANPDHLFVGADIGMFVSLDGGEIWLPFNTGLPLVSVTDLKIHKSSRKLVAATHGRSMFRISLDNPQPDPALITPVAGSTTFTPGKLDISWAGFTGPVRVLISYDGGRTFVEIAPSVNGSSFEFDAGLVRSDEVVIKVIEIATGREASSGLFSLKPQTNGQSLTSRGFHAEAIEVRGDQLWATSRTADSIYKMRVPTLLGRQALPMTGFPGRARDLAYDNARDQFYVLIAPENGANPRLFGMDTNATSTGEISLAALGGEPVVGIAMGPDGLTLIGPGASAKLFVIDPISGALLSTSQPLANTTDQNRVGLVWDGLTFVQGVITARNVDQFPSELQRIRNIAPPVIAERTPVVLPTDVTLYFRGLAFDASKPALEERVYFATDTAGVFYRFTYGDIFSSQISSVPIVLPAPGSVAIGTLSPNPARTTSTLDFVLKRGGDLSIGLYNATGEQIRSIAAGRFEQGTNRVTVDVAGLPSGVYNVAILTTDGERAVRSLVVVR